MNLADVLRLKRADLNDVQKAATVVKFSDFTESPDFVTVLGVATTPTPDRVGDIVEPKGAEFNLPIPFLLDHDTRQRIGQVVKLKVTGSAIEFEARIPKVSESGVLKDRIDEAVHSLKYGLLNDVSIGFRPLKNGMQPVNPKEPWDAQRFVSWELLELSMVTVPANPQARITSVKSAHAAATGNNVLRLSSPIPGAPGSIETKGIAMKTYAEKLKLWTEKRADLAAARAALMEKAEKDDDRVLTVEESAEHDKLTGELKQADEHIVRLKDLEIEAKSTAKAIDDESNQPAKVDVTTKSDRDTPHILNIKARDEEPGMRFARYVKCHMLAKGNPMLAQQLAKTLYPSERGLHTVIDAEAKHGEPITKSNVLAGTTTDATWAGALVQYQDMANEFLDWLRPQTIVGKFGMNGVPALTRVPFNARVRAQTSGGTAYWVGEGKPKPLTKFDFTNITMATTKIAAIAVVTQETLRLAAPSADMLIRNALRGAVVERMDRDFIDPDFAGSANVSPASITYGAPQVAAAGALNANVTSDTGLAIDALLAALPDATIDGLVWMMSGRQAYRLSQSVNSLGQNQFTGITLRGGNLGGIPVITSEYLAYGGGLSPGSNNIMVLVHAPSIFLADDGEVTIDASDQASLQMLDNPTNDVTTPTATSLVSMYQTNSVAIRAERYVNWKRARDGAVYVITGAAYTGLPS